MIQSITVMCLLSSNSALALVASPGLIRSQGTRTFIASTASARSGNPSVVHQDDSSTRSRRHPPSFISTQLSFRDEGKDDGKVSRSGEAVNKTRLRVLSWWESIIGIKEISAEEREQQIVDDYLVFLGKRYNRLRETAAVAKKEKDTKTEESQKFSVWDWLKDNRQPTKDVGVVNTRYEDALYVLGVAELASERLLQRHRMSSSQINPYVSLSQNVVIETNSKAVVDEGNFDLPRGLFGQMTGAGTAVMERIRSKQFVAQVYEQALMQRKLKDLVRALLREPLRAAKALQTAWQENKAKTAVKATAVAAFVAALSMFRPLVTAVKASIQL